MINMADKKVGKKVGKIIHYYGKICVAVIDVKSKLSVGDKIKFVKDKKELFQQEVTSIQKEHKDIPSAKKGEDVGMKVDQPVKEGVEVFKVE
jgi:putative protease